MKSSSSRSRTRTGGLPRRIALIAAASAQLVMVAPAQTNGEEREYDPRAGLDENGRIERPELPPDLPNPDRWRYTPPGRIAPGSVLERLFISSFVSPVIFRESDIGTGGGIALTDIDFRNQDYREFANILLTYTSEGQQSYTLDWSRWLYHQELPDGGIIRDERSRMFGRVGYSKTLTRRFFGLGSRTDEGDETSYTEELSELGFGVRLSLPDPGDDLIGTLAVGVQHHDLSSGEVSSVPSTDEVFPDEFSAGDGLTQLWVGLGLAYDSRDSLHQPYRGHRAGLSANTAVLQDGEDPGGVWRLDGQSVFPLPPLLHEGGDGNEENPPTDVLAAAVDLSDSYGDLPYYSLPSLGGSDTLRGYIENRFTDRAAVHGSLEYRFGVIPRGIDMTETIRIERVGLALFYDIGTVADGVEDLFDARFRDSYGMGLRLSFAREASFRLDYGISDEGGNLTIRFGNAF